MRWFNVTNDKFDVNVLCYSEHDCIVVLAMHGYRCVGVTITELDEAPMPPTKNLDNPEES